MSALNTVCRRYRCDACDGFIVGTRIHCLECEDFDLCLGCFNASRTPKRSCFYALWYTCEIHYRCTFCLFALNALTCDILLYEKNVAAFRFLDRAENHRLLSVTNRKPTNCHFCNYAFLAVNSSAARNETNYDGLLAVRFVLSMLSSHTFMCRSVGNVKLIFLTHTGIFKEGVGLWRSNIFGCQNEVSRFA